jgi:hypothetical protein
MWGGGTGYGLTPFPSVNWSYWSIPVVSTGGVGMFSVKFACPASPRLKKRISVRGIFKNWIAWMNSKIEGTTNLTSLDSEKCFLFYLLSSLGESQLKNTWEVAGCRSTTFLSSFIIFRNVFIIFFCLLVVFNSF